MYSPFWDKKGHPMSIDQIKYRHLSQLKECDEGHHVEYKLLLEDGGKSQLAKEIASFANCEGGWLIIGIDDKTKEIIPISKKDYSQRIGKIASRISPMPEFNTRFLTTPDDKETGVLVVYVYEGKNAPYICNGSVYVRSGSSKEPIKPADRGNIEYLYERTKENQKSIENFCKRDYYYAYNGVLQHKPTYPIANVYLKSVGSKVNDYFKIYANRDKFIEFIKSQFNVFEHVTYSMDSIIFMHKFVPPGSMGGTLVFEFYYDWSCKITVPISNLEDDDKKSFASLFSELGIDSEIINKAHLVSGTIVSNALFLGVKLFEKVAKQYKLKECDYIFCIELENIGETVPVFEGKKYKEYIEEYGIPYAHKEINKSKLLFLRDYPKLKFEQLSEFLVADNLGAAFGIRSDSALEILQDSNKKYL